MQLDSNGREIKAGDLLKIPHFRAARRRRKVYMYKLVVRVTSDRIIHKDGAYLYAVDVGDIHDSGSLEKAHRCTLSCCEECEIIDGGSVDGNDLFWERPNRKGNGDSNV